MQKILLDTDIGGDIDDAVCLAYLLREPQWCFIRSFSALRGALSAWKPRAETAWPKRLSRRMQAETWKLPDPWIRRIFMPFCLPR